MPRLSVGFSCLKIINRENNRRRVKGNPAQTKGDIQSAIPPPPKKGEVCMCVAFYGEGEDHFWCGRCLVRIILNQNKNQPASMSLYIHKSEKHITPLPQLAIHQNLLLTRLLGIKLSFLRLYYRYSLCFNFHFIFRLFSFFLQIFLLFTSLYSKISPTDKVSHFFPSPTKTRITSQRVRQVLMTTMRGVE
jgi:hypothetical protein